MPKGIKSCGRVLIVLHQKHSTPGRLGRLLRAQGFELDCRRPCFDDPLPETLRNYAGAIVFGGPMSVNDEDTWVRREIDWIGVPLKEDTPFL
ncbi:MAG TPA: glutamine amidotransferase, partial [Methylocella sp.]|nr:glutamine amidotransferase [Methylocella sp.]